MQLWHKRTMTCIGGRRRVQLNVFAKDPAPHLQQPVKHQRSVPQSRSRSRCAFPYYDSSTPVRNLHSLEICRVFTRKHVHPYIAAIADPWYSGDSKQILISTTSTLAHLSWKGRPRAQVRYTNSCTHLESHEMCSPLSISWSLLVLLSFCCQFQQVLSPPSHRGSHYARAPRTRRHIGRWIHFQSYPRSD